jgi:hypothetical protein
MRTKTVKSRQLGVRLTEEQFALLERVAGDELLEPVTWARRVLLLALAKAARLPIRGNVSPSENASEKAGERAA